MGIKFVSYFFSLFFFVCVSVDMFFRVLCFIVSTRCSTQAHSNLQLFDKQQIREIDWNHWNGCTLSNILYRIASDFPCTPDLSPAASKHKHKLSNYSIESLLFVFVWCSDSGSKFFLLFCVCFSEIWKLRYIFLLTQFC